MINRDFLLKGVEVMFLTLFCLDDKVVVLFVIIDIIQRSSESDIVKCLRIL